MEKVEPEIPGSLSPDLAGPGFEAAAATATGSSGTCWTRSAVEREASSYPWTRISSSSSSCAGLEPVEARAEGRPGKNRRELSLAWVYKTSQCSSTKSIIKTISTSSL